MAIQDRNGKIKGKINNIVYRESQGQQIMQIIPARVKQTYATKLSALEFGVASAQAKTLRRVFRRVYEEADGKMAGRLNAAVAACLRTANLEVGERTLHDSDLDSLKGFQFNTDAPIEKRIAVRPIYDIAPNGQFHFKLPVFNPMSDITYPPSDIRLDSSLTIALIAVQFQEEYVQVIDSETFDIQNLNREVKIDWVCNRQLPQGFIVFAVLSLRYFSVNWVGQKGYTTDKAFYPTIILDAFHVSEDIASRGIADGLEMPIKEKLEFGHRTNDVLKKVTHFKEKMAKAQK